MIFFNKEEIIGALPSLEEMLITLERSFISYSKGDYIIPPVGQLPIKNGEIHIKYGLESNSDIAVIKIAAGSFRNHEYGLPSSSGLNLIYDTKTGFPLALLQDQGILTDIRTAVTGALVARRFTHNVKKFTIIGSGGQAFFQALYTCKSLKINKVYVFGRQRKNVEKLSEKLLDHGIYVIYQDEIETACRGADLITTTTSSNSPLIYKNWLSPNVHINAFGADSPNKRELSPDILMEAAIVLVDSSSQCFDHGELQYFQKSQISPIELGKAFMEKIDVSTGISVCDFTGVAIQDIKISEVVYKKLCLSKVKNSNIKPQ